MCPRSSEMRGLLTTLLLVAVSGTAFARPDVSISIQAEKEIYVTENGQPTVKRVDADNIYPGEVLIYTLRFANSGDESALNVVIDDPIPEATSYVPGSAFGEGSQILFSIDGGATFKRPSLLTYVVYLNGREEQRIASADQYTHIRWVVQQIKAGEKGEVGFKVKVK